MTTRDDARQPSPLGHVILGRAASPALIAEADEHRTRYIGRPLSHRKIAELTGGVFTHTTVKDWIYGHRPDLTNPDTVNRLRALANALAAEDMTGTEVFDQLRAAVESTDRSPKTVIRRGVSQLTKKELAVVEGVIEAIILARGERVDGAETDETGVAISPE